MEKTKRRSKKRDAILELIKSTKVHPSAEWIYETLKEEFPDLSLGTVYRNLAEFREEGKLMSVGYINGRERFDGETNPHGHFKCSCCGSVIDTEGVKISPQILKEVEEQTGGKISAEEVSFYGMCSECLKRA